MVMLLVIPINEGRAQLLLGSITGTVTDSTGAGVPGVKVVARNMATNLKQEAVTQASGLYQISDLPIGVYMVTFTKEGFETEVHHEIAVQGNRISLVLSMPANRPVSGHRD